VIRSLHVSLALLGTASLVFLAGCSGGGTGPNTVPVKGTLTIDGQPAKDVTITLSPLDSKLPVATGQVSNGAFELRTGKEGKLGAVPGRYKVTLTAMISTEAAAAAYKPGMKGPPKIEASFPSKYASASTSDKEVEVKAGSNELKIDITK